ncbi:alpha/beta fold hydrolase [Buchnera aphidicola]|uniref:alpha/beta fold hydrolase n=1 Tax=Buchnera aphidicola TaxID=9 RepID=UPI0031B71763
MKKIFYSIQGKGKIPIILLHGWGLDSNIWKNFLFLFSSQYTIYIIDFPGYGKNFFLKNMSFKEISKFLLKIIPKKVIWIGWSLGGLLATYMSYYFPKRTYGTILITSSPYFLKTKKWPGISKKILKNLKKKMIFSYENFLKEFYFSQMYIYEKKKNKNQYINLKKFLKHQPSSYTINYGYQWLIKIDNRKKILNLKTPIFRIYGELDLLVPYKIENYLQKYIINGQSYIIPHSAHIPFISHPINFTKIIKNIFKKIFFQK